MQLNFATNAHFPLTVKLLFPLQLSIGSEDNDWEEYSLHNLFQIIIPAGIQLNKAEIF